MEGSRASPQKKGVLKRGEVGAFKGQNRKGWEWGLPKIKRSARQFRFWGRGTRKLKRGNGNIKTKQNIIEERGRDTAAKAGGGGAGPEGKRGYSSRDVEERGGTCPLQPAFRCRRKKT